MKGWGEGGQFRLFGGRASSWTVGDGDWRELRRESSFLAQVKAPLVLWHRIREIPTEKQASPLEKSSS